MMEAIAELTGQDRVDHYNEVPSGQPADLERCRCRCDPVASSVGP